MPRCPRVTAVETARKLRNDGWYFARQTGSHAQYFHRTKPGTVTIPMRGSAILHPQVLKSILRQARLTVQQFIAL